MPADTIAALSSPPGRGGVAVVRVSGPDAFQIATALSGRRVDASLAGTFFHSKLARGGAPFDDALVLVFAAPRSYTGEDVVEFHVHGGSVAPRRALEAVFAAGARPARRGEFTLRAFLSGKLGISEAEAVIDLIDAKTDRAADEALARLGGKTSRRDDALYREAVSLSAELEHALDFTDDELPDSFAPAVGAHAARLVESLGATLADARGGRILRNGALVVIAGAPNAGKSSLMNALLGERRAIVSEIAGTTRDSIEEWLDIDGWPVRLVDTAGLRETDDVVEAEGVRRSEALIAKADAVVELSPEGSFRLGGIPDSRILRVFSKCDLPGAPRPGLAVSAVTGEGVLELKRRIAGILAASCAFSTTEEGVDAASRRRRLLEQALSGAREAGAAVAAGDLVVAANGARSAAERLGELAGRVYSEDLIDAVFSRFCVGK